MVILTRQVKKRDAAQHGVRMNSSVHCWKNEGPPSCVGARGLDYPAPTRQDRRSHLLRSWDKCGRSGMLPRPIAPPS